MNMSYITGLEKLRGKDLSAYELSQLLQHKLQYNIVNLNIPETEQLMRVLVQYKKERMQHYGMLQEGLSTSAPALPDMRAEAQFAACLLGTTGE